ncbi:two-component system response regulator AlgR [Inhella inkyongensis]|uniref:Two-component system response regulator AlgR n=1 Tax=Inhella inkyongensis TaxID=392593 RepID=A0A840S410_9BURK|nr:LytTR family DNA-binding domain-containing protein [Inhella inkyongensis]MBB5206007.1 two-component system response regulator AlgR [Inhella inkyongensis]
MLTQAPMKVLIVDDEPLARARLKALLQECRDPHAEVMADVGTASAAQAWLREHACDLVLLDVQMPGPDGLMLADSLRNRSGGVPAPLVVFVTAHARHALEAFELDAVDYLTKPLRLERLQATLQRVAQRLREREAAQSAEPAQEGEVLSIFERGRVVRVPLSEVLYMKAELKYLTVRTAQQRYVMDGTLGDWEQRLAGRFLRVHRNALVAKAAVRELDRHGLESEAQGTDFAALDAEGNESWAVRIAVVNEWLTVSRRQLGAVREALKAQAG